ncbi:MAG: thioredoxin family protein [Firmicutes bacterium]|nr:thioredoxin family protein [Bacillota bacterium]
MKEITQAMLQDEIATGNTILKFFSLSCGNCKLQEKILSDLATEHASIKFIKIDTAKATEAIEKYDVMSLPALAFIKDGNTLEVTSGLKPKVVVAKKIVELF